MSTDDQANIKKEVIQLGYKSDLKETERIKHATLIERKWWRHQHPYQNYAAISDDVKELTLVMVKPTKNYLPALRFRNPKLHHLYPPFLEWYTKQLLDELTDVWRERMNQSKQDIDIRLAIANMTITEDYQKQLVASGKLAILGNPHVRGVAFDIDASAYYLGEIPVNDRKKVKNQYSEKFTSAGAYVKAPEYLNFSSKLTQLPLTLFEEVLAEFKDQKKLNFVHEYPGTNNSSFHICRNPEYQP